MNKKNKIFAGTLLSLFCFFASPLFVAAQQVAYPSSSLIALTNVQQEKTEEQLLNNPLITFLLKYVEINKLTIFAMGLTVIGILFLLMSIFIPCLAKRQQQAQLIKKDNNSSRRNIHKKVLPVKEAVLILGLIFVLIGVVLQTFNHIS